MDRCHAGVHRHLFNPIPGTSTGSHEVFENGEGIGGEGRSMVTLRHTVPQASCPTRLVLGFYKLGTVFLSTKGTCSYHQPTALSFSIPGR